MEISLCRHPEWHKQVSFQQRPALTCEFGMDKARASKCHIWLTMNQDTCPMPPSVML